MTMQSSLREMRDEIRIAAGTNRGPRSRLVVTALPAALAVAAAVVVPGLSGCHDIGLHAFIMGHRRPMIFAHRGGGGIAPEATIPTMLDTFSRNPDAVVEFDVHRSSDGALIVIHDATVDRTTNGTGPVSGKTLAELKSLDAGYCATPGQGNGTDETGNCHTADPAAGPRFPFRGQGYQIPTLSEVLTALPVEALLSIEVKQSGIERQVADLLRATGRLSKMVVGAEFDEMAARIKDALPEVPGYLPTGAAKCFVISTKAGWDYPACPTYEIFASPLTGAGLALDTRGVIDAAHHLGIAVVYWTINDEATIERIFRLGADGLYTDYPDRARLVLERLRQQGTLP